MPNIIVAPTPIDCIHCMGQGDDCSKSLGPYAHKGRPKKVPCRMCSGKGYVRPGEPVYYAMKAFKDANDKLQAEEDRYMLRNDRQRKKLITSAMRKLTADERKALGYAND